MVKHELNRKFFETLYQSSEVEEGVQKVLAMIGERFSVSRVYVFENTDDDFYADNTFEWCADGIEPQIDDLQHMSYEQYGYRELFGEDGLFFSADVRALEPMQRELFEMQGIKATMQYAMYEKGRFRGFIGVDDCFSARPDWDKDKEILDTLILLSQILTMYLLKERNLQRSRTYHEQLTQALEQANEIKQEREHQLNSALRGMNGGIAVYRCTMDGKLTLLSFTDGVAGMHGCTREEYGELTKQNPLRTTIPEERGYMTAKILALLKSRDTLSMTYRGYHKEKGFIWINLSAFPMGNDAEGCLRYTAVFTTASREFEAYQELIDNSENGVIVSDRKTNEVYISNQAAKQLMREWELEPFSGSIEPKKVALNNGNVYQIFTHEIDWLGRSAIARYFVNLTEETALRNEIARQYRELKAQYDFEIEKQNEPNEDIVERIMIDLTENRVLQVTSQAGARVDKMLGLTTGQLLDLRLTHTKDAKERQELSRLMNRKALLDAYLHAETPEAEIKAHFPGTVGRQYFSTTARMVKNPENEHILAFLTTRNIDRQKIREMLALRLLEVSYSTVLLIYAETGKIKFGHDKDNERFMTKIDMTYDEMIRLSLQDNIVPEHQERVFQETCLAAIQKKLQESSNYSNRIGTMRNGKMVYRTWDASYFDEEKELILMITADVTEAYQKDLENNRRLEEALGKAQKAAQAKTDFLARMSHDMRTPLNAILGMVHLAKEDYRRKMPITGYIRQIEESSQYLLGVINDLLEMSRIESGNITITPDWYSLSDLVMPVIRMIEPMIEKKALHFECDITRLQALKIEFYVDAQKFRQMLINILNNACKFTPEGGTVSFCFVNISQDVESGLRTDKLVIQDTGCGMSEEFLTHIFQPFEQERLPGTESIPGTGLGLSIAYNNARKMGGDIAVTSELGKGSTFTITHTHPYRILTDDAPQERDASLQEVYRVLDGKYILLAEDNEINAMIATKILENKGMRVKLARNGQEAVDAFLEKPEGTYALILMDIRMPILDGLEATKKIRATDRTDAKILPIVAMSANAFEEDRQLSLESGMTDHLSKPVKPELLYQTILKYVK